MPLTIVSVSKTNDICSYNVITAKNPFKKPKCALDVVLSNFKNNILQDYRLLALWPDGLKVLNVMTVNNLTSCMCMN